MAWYPGARKLELQPESDSQMAIRPTQLIMHSIAAPWTVQRIYEYWRDSTNLESHFGLAYDGDLGQFIGTQTRADANMYANHRPDGSGGVSIETASNLQHTDPWTPEQIESLIQLGVWMHTEHGLPLRICRSHDDPGYGYHRMFPEWSDGGTACPGDARVAQFKTVVFPGIVARATGQQEDDMPTAAEIADAVWEKQLLSPVSNKLFAAQTFLRYEDRNFDTVNKSLAAMQASISALATLLGNAHPNVDTATLVAAVQQAIADAVVKVDVSVHDQAT